MKLYNCGVAVRIKQIMANFTYNVGMLHKYVQIANIKPEMNRLNANILGAGDIGV